MNVIFFSDLVLGRLLIILFGSFCLLGELLRLIAVYS